jgi:DNA-binding SARP family transcriptional activator
VRRDWLAWLLWPQRPEAAALANLRNCLKDLRRSLGSEAGRLHTPTARTLSVDLAGAAVDIIAFDQAVVRGDVSSLEEAVALYRGPLLEECAEEWTIPERQQREQAYLAALETLARAALGGQRMTDGMKNEEKAYDGDLRRPAYLSFTRSDGEEDKPVRTSNPVSDTDGARERNAEP